MRLRLFVPYCDFPAGMHGCSVFAKHPQGRRRNLGPLSVSFISRGGGWLGGLRLGLNRFRLVYPIFGFRGHRVGRWILGW